MGLASEMKNLSEELLSSFKQRIRENEELVSDVQKTLDSFRKDHQEMAAVLNANAAALRKGLANGEKDRLNAFNNLMTDIRQTIASIQKEVADIQVSTTEMIEEFTTDRAEMAVELDKTFAQDRAERMQNEKTRMKEFNALMKNINNDIKSINDEVMGIFKNTNDMLDRFEKEHLDMSAELRAELGKNLTERVEYTRTLLHGFQKRLSEIGKENQKMAQKLRKDLANGETTRLNDYKGLMKDIHTSIKGIRKEVKDIQKASNGMIGDYAQGRSQGAEAWNKMQETITQLRKTGVVKPAKEVVGKAEKKEVKIETLIEAVKGAIIKEESTITSFPIETPVDVQPKAEPKPEVPITTLEEKVLGYINRHPLGVKVSEMEEPLGETRMKIGFVAKALLEEGKVQKMDNIYFPLK